MASKRGFTRLKAFIAALSATVATAVVIGSPSTALATGSEGFTFLQPGFTQTLWGINPSFLGGVAFATNGDVLADHCGFSGSSLADYSQTSTTTSNGSTLHNFTELPSNAGCGLTNHPDGTLYTNTSSGVVNLDASTGAQLRGPFGTAGNALGIAADPITGNLIYVGSGGDSYNLFFVNSAFTSSGTFSTADASDFKDQITWSPDGKFLFISNRTAPLKLEIVDRNGNLVQNVPMSSEPDGIAFHAAAPQFVVTNNTDGTMTRFDFPGNDYTMTPTQSVFASGGFRGDMAVVGSDSCLYLTQAGTRYANGTTDFNNSIVQICGGFAPTVPDQPIAATGTAVSAVEGQPFAGTVATFTDPDPKSTAAEYTATIDWGDGTPTSAGTISGPTGGPFTVSGSHTYAEEGSRTVTVTITDIDTITNTATVTPTATVSDAALTASAACMTPTPQSYNAPTATFTDAASPSGTLSDFSASIAWGDGSSSTGTVSGPDGGPYTVSGTHTYASTGNFTIVTTIKDVGGSVANAVCGTLAFAFAPGGGSFAIGDGNSAVGTSVEFWGQNWSKVNTLSGGMAPSSFKGFAASPKTPTCGSVWTTDTGNSTPPPPGPLPAYMAVIVTSKVTQSGSTDTGNTVHIVVVSTNPGYTPDPSTPGTGTVVAVVC